MPRLILTCVILGVLFCTLWTPAFFVARHFWRKGDWGAMRALKVMCPLQLVLAGGLIFAADAAGFTNPAGYSIAIIVGVSLAGAAAFAAWRLLLGFIAR